MNEAGTWSETAEANVARALNQQNLIVVSGYEEGASQWCTGSLSFPEAVPAHDSHGDCTECGEELIWVVLDGS